MAEGVNEKIADLRYRHYFIKVQNLLRSIYQLRGDIIRQQKHRVSHSIDINSDRGERYKVFSGDKNSNGISISRNRDRLEIDKNEQKIMKSLISNRWNEVVMQEKERTKEIFKNKNINKSLCSDRKKLKNSISEIKKSQKDVEKPKKSWLPLLKNDSLNEQIKERIRGSAKLHQTLASIHDRKIKEKRQLEEEAKRVEASLRNITVKCIITFILIVESARNKIEVSQTKKIITASHSSQASTLSAIYL